VGYEYLDIAGIEVLIRQYRRFWALRVCPAKGGRQELPIVGDVGDARKDAVPTSWQVKFTINSDRYELNWGCFSLKPKKEP